VEIVDLAFLRRSASALARIESQLRGLVWPAATVLISLVLLVSGKLGRDYYIDPKLFPVDAVNWLQDNPQSGHMFNSFIWGGYMVWRLWPGQMDFIDSQSDLTGEATKSYLTVERLEPGWQGVLQQYNVKWVIMPADSALGLELAKEGWITLYKDSTAVILRQE
jgi:hypothetical protein